MSAFSLSKALCSLLLAPLGLIAWSSAQAATTYYVRTDGGTASQCTGRANAPYPGSGSAQACAWNHPSVALPASGSPRIAGGDTLLIGGGSYSIGSSLQAVPSGASTARTRILGNAGTPPRLIGKNGISHILSLKGSSHVEVGNLEITDGSDCVYAHSVSSVACTSATPWARGGIYA
ncbi:hypothetical protein, partial [Cognatiluteimonas weifangensis]